MSKFQGVGRASSLVIFSLITFVLLIHVNFAAAGDIGTNQGFDTVTVLAGQSAEVDTTQIIPFGMHTVVFFSVGNQIVKGGFEIGRNQNAVGLWYLILFGPGGHDASTRSLDVASGLIAAESGAKAEANIDNWCLGFVTGGALLFSPVSAANPFKYTISVTGTQRAPVH
jgi:hypothetical protein